MAGGLNERSVTVSTVHSYCLLLSPIEDSYAIELNISISTDCKER